MKVRLRIAMDRVGGVVVGGVGLVLFAVMSVVVIVGAVGAVLSVLFFPVGLFALVVLGCLKLLGAL